MAKHTMHRNGNYTMMANFHFKDANLSFKAKGILSLMFSLPDDWDFSAKGLTALGSDGYSSVNAGLQELEKYGYLVRSPIKANGKIIDWQYDFYESPQVGFPQMEIPQMENLEMENRNQLNTYLINNLSNKRTKELNTGDFEKFWNAYPKKKSKADAEKAFKKVKVPVEVLLNAIEKQKKSADWIKNNGQYIPYPSTWLNGKRWEDETDTGFMNGHVHFDGTDVSHYEKIEDRSEDLNEW